MLASLFGNAHDFAEQLAFAIAEDLVGRELMFAGRNRPDTVDCNDDRVLLLRVHVLQDPLEVFEMARIGDPDEDVAGADVRGLLRSIRRLYNAKLFLFLFCSLLLTTVVPLR